MGERITIEARDGHRLGAWLATPEGEARGAVVVVQEIFGVTAHIRDVADRFATAGYLAIAPQLLDRAQRDLELPYDDAGQKRAREIVASIGFDNALRDVAAAEAHVRHAGTVAAVGFCWGGTVAFLACTRLRLPAVSYYGGRSVPFLHERPDAPLLLHFGDHDPIIPPADRAAIVAALPDAETHVYDASHAFNRDGTDAYVRDAATLAWQRTLDFLARAGAAT